jgi:hypothetical protein
MNDRGFGITIIMLLVRLLSLLVIVGFSAWLIYIGHPGYLWLAVLYLFSMDMNTKIYIGDETKSENKNVDEIS